MSTMEQIRRQQRTLVLKKMPRFSTTSKILDDLCKVTSADNIEAVHRDQLDHGLLYMSPWLDPRRFYVTFSSLKLKRELSIRGSYRRRKVTYIPYPPPYLDADDLTQILSEYGTVLQKRFRRARNRRTIIGGFELEIVLKEDVLLPKSFTFDNVDHTILD